MFDMAKMMAQAKKVQDKMAKIQDDLEHLEVTGKAGGGQVKVVCNGKFEFKSVFIDPALLAKGDSGMVEDLMLAALKDCTDQIMKHTQDKMESLTAGLNIPGLKLPF
jgi:nucleoid-associated protein EbfC